MAPGEVTGWVIRKAIKTEEGVRTCWSRRLVLVAKMIKKEGCCQGRETDPSISKSSISKDTAFLLLSFLSKKPEEDLLNLLDLKKKGRTWFL